jgi:signal transduction histidine kinase
LNRGDGAPAGGQRGAAGGFLGLGLFRSPRHRLISGVAGGIGERLGIDPVLVRGLFALLAVGGGVGLIAYLVLWAAMPLDEGPQRMPETSDRKALAACMVVAGLLIMLHESGLWLGDALAWSVALAALGFAVIWARSDATDRARWNKMAGRVAEQPLDLVRTGPIGPLRILLGLGLLGGGLVTAIATTGAVGVARNVVVAAAVTTAGLGLLFGPWVYRLVGQVGEERRERIRSQERSEMAAHLHDSVLQTLALIQRAEGSREMVALARNQERALRAWLNDGARRGRSTLAAAIEETASAVELQFKVPVEVVTVGDTSMDDRLRALVDACGEATINAAKHSGADRISVYVEVEPTTVTAFVRDQGTGFAPAEVATDRRGISDSINGRMRRAGGSALVSTEPGQGTEVQLSISRSPA